MAGWGLGGWGLSPWGLGGASSFTILLAHALTERSVGVYLSKSAAARSTIIPGDALNPTTWAMTRNDTGEQLLVLASRDLGDALAFELFILGKLGSSLVEHTVSAPSLLTPSGETLVPPTFYDFAGCKAVKVKASPASMVDIKNSSTSGTEIGGVLEVGSDGDYAIHSGMDMLRKLVIRRLVTVPGEFFFYDRSYGVGFRVKEPLPNVNLVKLRNQIELQLQQEPEFSRVAVRLTLSPSGVLNIHVSALLRRTNEEVVVPIAVPSALVSL